MKTNILEAPISANVGARGAQGGYFCRAEHLRTVHLPTLAREALLREKVSAVGVTLVVTPASRANVTRVSFERPGDREGAVWYSTHHAMAQLLSSGQTLAVHAYVYLPFELEEVVAYADGRRVGGERVRYQDVEPTDEEAADDALFERLQSRWPLGHLAQVFGVPRRELLRLVRRAATTRHSL